MKNILPIILLAISITSSFAQLDTFDMGHFLGVEKDNYVLEIDAITKDSIKTEEYGSLNYTDPCWREKQQITYFVDRNHGYFTVAKGFIGKRTCTDGNIYFDCKNVEILEPIYPVVCKPDDFDECRTADYLAYEKIILKYIVNSKIFEKLAYKIVDRIPDQPNGIKYIVLEGMGKYSYLRSGEIFIYSESKFDW